MGKSKPADYIEANRKSNAHIHQPVISGSHHKRDATHTPSLSRCTISRQVFETRPKNKSHHDMASSPRRSKHKEDHSNDRTNIMTDNLNRTGKVQRPAASHLFLVRLWEEAPYGPDAHKNTNGAAGREWKGKVQHVVSGESHTFQDLASLLDYLRAMMPTTPE